MASATSSLESTGSNESISHSYVSNERHNPPQTPQIPSMPIDYELSPTQCYDKTNYAVSHGHAMSAPYELGQYEAINKQAAVRDETLKQQCEKALHDLSQLRRQHTETSRRCEHVMKVYINRQAAVRDETLKQQCEKALHDLSQLRRQHTETSRRCEHVMKVYINRQAALRDEALKQQCEKALHDLSQLRRQHTETSRRCEHVMKVYIDRQAAVRDETLKQQCEKALHDLSQLRRQHTETSRRCEHVMKVYIDRQAAVRDETLKQQCEKALHDLSQLRRQHTETSRRCEHVMKVYIDRQAAVRDETLKQQCEKALHDLSQLRRQHTETSRRCEHVMKVYIDRQAAVRDETLKQQCEKALHDLSQLRRQHTETSRRCEHVMKVYIDRQAAVRDETLKQQCEKALHDLSQLRRQHTETSRRCEHVMKVYINRQAAVRDETLKQQCEKALHDLSQLRRQHTETSRRCEHVMKVYIDRQAAVRDETLKQQCEKALHDLSQLRRQHTETSRRCEHVMKVYINRQAAVRDETLKQQCEKALHDLSQLRRQHTETSRRCEHVMKELEYFRGQHRAAMTQLDVSAQEASSLRGKYGDLLNDNQRLEREVQHLSAGGGAEGADALVHTLRKYDALKEELDCFQKRYDELIQNHNSTLETLRLVQEENARLKSQCHELTQERNAVIRERVALEAQVAGVLRQWEGGARERSDLKRLTDERNAALAEYTLIMSERDTVHKEMEKLSDDLQAALKRVAALEAALQASRDEQRATALQAESLRREIECALAERDRAIKECTDLKAPQNISTLAKSRQDNSAYHHLGLASGATDGFLNGQHSIDPSIDKLTGCIGGEADKARVETLEQANAELQRVRARSARLHQDLRDALQEAEVSKRRRDWAFAERDKLLQERESVKALCNRLRKERDQMVGELADARRHGGKKAGGDGKDGKTRAKSHDDKCRLTARDSAVDADVQDFEWEIIEVELGALAADGSLGSLGLELAGGSAEPYFPGDCSVYVTAVRKGSLADGKIKVLDRIAEACGVSQWARGSACAAAVRAALARGPVPLRLQRARAARRLLRLAAAAACGVTLQHGIFISKIACGSAAAKEGNIYVGDRVVSINNRSLEGVKSVAEATAMLNDCQYDSVLLTVLRPLYPCCDPRNRLPLSAGPAEGKVNICSQTEEAWPHFLPPPPENKVHADHGADFDRRYVYHVAAGSQGKIHQERGTWDMIRGTIEAVTGRAKSKDKQNKVPESDAIAELDSVIDSYHGKIVKETSSVIKRSRRKNKESHNDAKNGGTWPKARANFVLDDTATGTVAQPRARKERPPLSILLSPPTKLPPEPQRSNANRNSNPIPLAHVPITSSTTPARHSVYKSIESSPAIEHFPKPAPLAIHNPFASPANFDKTRTLDKDKMSMSEYEHDVTPNRLSLVLNPSDDSLDYQPPTRNRTKSPHSLDFSVNKGPSSLDFTRKSPNSLEHSIKNHPGKDILDQYYLSKKSSPKIVTTSNKYPSDSDSFGPDSLAGTSYLSGTLPSQSRLQAQYYRGPFANSNPHGRYRHPPSPDMAGARSGDSLAHAYDAHPFSHAHNMSDLQPARAPCHAYEGGTFPRKKENQRFRIPSNPSVTSKNSAGKLSTGSIERSSERSSPMPTFHVDVLSPGRGAKQLTHKGTRNSMPEYCGLGWDKPLPGELRRVHIDKSQQPLGIQIYCPPASGGVFVSTVNEHSLASQVGLQVGDQLLEVCGINMRSATYTLAASVLRQIGNSITMLVQYSPDKYKDEMEVPGSSSADSSDDDGSLSGSPTPRNSPGPQQSRLDAPPDLAHRQQANKELPRFLLIEMRNCSDLGISLVGGNAVGIFVHSVQAESPAHACGLRTGDQILEYNSVDLRRATAEQAALELAKPADKVSVLVRHDLQQYHEMKDKPGDAFYIRAGFDRCAKMTSAGVDTVDEYSLWFRKDEVLFVDNTLFNGAPGLWRAWQLDCKGAKRHWGTIPSKFKVEEILRRSPGGGAAELEARRAGSTARRSFFRRKKHRDSKELASFSNTELGCWSDSGTLADDAPPLSYQRVERLHYGSRRPVTVLGPLRECVAGKLVSDWPHVFARAKPDPRVLRELADKGIHCILEASVSTLERLHKQQVYPIVLLIKFKSFKQIKELKDTRFPADKVSAKAAKEMYEHGLKVENEYRNYISAEIPAGVNIAYMCTQIKEAVEEEQNKTLWVPSAQA